MHAIMHCNRVLGLVIAFAVNIYLVESTIFLIDFYKSKMVELPENNQPCKVHQDRLLMQNTLNRVDPRYIQRVHTDILNAVSRSCKNSSSPYKTGFIFPGTKWCGPGNVANGFNDLGSHANEDRCCRDHDHCPNQLEPGQCRHGICNISPFTRSHCDCDETFRKCLRTVNSEVANVIGTVYFNIVQGACFKERRFCLQAMKDNLSYSWFCKEWKLVPFEYFTPSLIVKTNEDVEPNEISRKPIQETLNHNTDWKKIFGEDEDVAKILNKS